MTRTSNRDEDLGAFGFIYADAKYIGSQKCIKSWNLKRQTACGSTLAVDVCTSVRTACSNGHTPFSWYNGMTSSVSGQFCRSVFWSGYPCFQSCTLSVCLMLNHCLNFIRQNSALPSFRSLPVSGDFSLLPGVAHSCSFIPSSAESLFWLSLPVVFPVPGFPSRCPSLVPLRPFRRASSFFSLGFL